MHLTVGIFGDMELAKSLGKKGTANDIAIFNHSSSEGVFTYVCPNSDKVQPLLQAMNMVDVPVLVINQLTKETGEMIVGLDEMGFEKGFIITGVKEQLQPLIKGTSLERFEFVDEQALRQKLMGMKVDRPAEPLMVPIDNYFKVKSVGTIVLGIVRSGAIKKYDKVMLEPLGREVLVKGIQAQDVDFDHAEAGMRVGLNLKGVEVEELDRGFVICKEIEKSADVRAKFRRNRFSKQNLKEGMNVLLSAGLQVVSCAVKSAGEDVVLSANRPIAYTKRQRCILALQGDVYPRIMGSGEIL
jgi:selenocysteine-specific translation elongation factor